MTQTEPTHTHPAMPQEPVGLPSDALLPPRGQQVWVSHPVFARDEILAALLASCVRAVADPDPDDDPTLIAELGEWVNGRVPIPDEEVENFLKMRAAEARGRGLALPTIRETSPSGDLAGGALAFD